MLRTFYLHYIILLFENIYQKIVHYCEETKRVAANDILYQSSNAFSCCPLTIHEDNQLGNELIHA